MRVVFMGTPALAAAILTELAAAHDVVGVFTRPDAVRGRGKRLAASEVKELACELGIPVFTPGNWEDGGALGELRALAPDVACVSAYGMVLPEDVLAAARLGFLNVHTSLLPRWRGAAPIERAILAGDERTGVCIMRMEAGLDTGPVCVRREVEVAGRSAAELAGVLARDGASALLEALELVEAGRAVWEEQAAEGVVYADKIAKGELNPTPADDSRAFCAKVRAASAAHPARAEVAGKTLSVERARAVDDEQGLAACMGMEPGEARFAMKRLFAGVADGAVELLQVKPDGKKSMEAKAFAGGIQGIKNARIRWGRC